MWTALFGLVCTVLCLFYFVMRRRLGFWQAKGVTVPPMSPWFGHLRVLLMKHHRWEYIDTLYRQYKDLPYWGMYEFGAPCLFLRDRDIIKAVTVKDADHFTDRRDIPFNTSGSESDATFAEMLLHQQDAKWKTLRALLSPTFTSGKIKAMFPLISNKADELVSFFEKKAEGKSMVAVGKPLGSYAVGVSGICAFGLDVPISDDESEFGSHCETLSSLNFLSKTRLVMMSVFPAKLNQLLGLQLTANSTLYFNGLVERIVQERKDNNIRREDFLDLLEDLLNDPGNSGEGKFKMTKRTVAAQSIVFLLAGLDTTSNSLACACFLMGKNPEAQDKLRKELKKIYEADGKFTYQNIMDAPYLGACFSETLRMYGPAHFTDRKCTRDYKFDKTGLMIERGMTVVIPNWSLHYDPDLWEEPCVYKPERFLPENKNTIQPLSYIPFGSGPRNCIGMRFAQLEARLALAKLLINHRITLPEGHDQLTMSEDLFVLKPKQDSIKIIYEKIDKE